MRRPWLKVLFLERTVKRLAPVLLYFTASVAQGATLQEQVDHAISAFTKGDYHEVYWTFEAVELDYGREPEFLDQKFQKTILPVRAYAAMMAERPTDALVYFRALLSEHEVSPALRAFVHYNTAVALAQTDALAQAARVFRDFRLSYSGSNESYLAGLQEADLLAEIGETAQAHRLLDDFYRSLAPESLRMQGRLRALQLASETGDSDRVNELLFQTDWRIERMPDIAVLSFSAVQAGDLLLEKDLYDEAVRAYRLSLPKDVLIEKQHERLVRARQTYQEQATFASRIWKSYISRLIARIEGQLKRLESMPDYTAGLYLRRGQAYLLGERYQEAAVLFKTMAQSDRYEEAVRAQAHYRWILSLIQAEAWHTARASSDLFLKAYPEHDLANSAAFLIARAYQGEGRFIEAIEILDGLIAAHPDDQQAPRWYFTRGYNYCLLEDQAKARADFETGATRFPKSTLQVQFKMWAGLTYFFERNYPKALERLEALAESAPRHPLFPEIRYRIANTLYAMREHADALEVIQSLIDTFPDHYRTAEALALKGDIHMALGELVTAATTFRRVPPDDLRIYDYATFQTAKIYRALERYDLLREHLQAYVEREDANTRPRVSEALYWVGWSYQQEGRPEKSFSLFENALERFGNDPQARAVASILSGYAELYRKVGKGDDFALWLQKASEQSLKDSALTWFARLAQFEAQRERRLQNTARADATLLSIHRLVPIEQQDATALASVGEVLARRGYLSADEYFERILNHYPEHSERAAAFYGKAMLASQQDRLEKSRHWLVRFLEETPTHPLAADARVLAADVLRRQGLYQAAEDGLKEMLRLKNMRGRPHARALAGLAKIEMDKGAPKRAIPYWQRIYTLYRAYPELLAEAYWESARLFQAIDDPVAARNTLEEMLRDERLKGFEEYASAEAALPGLVRAAQKRNNLAEQGRPKTESEGLQ